MFNGVSSNQTRHKTTLDYSDRYHGTGNNESSTVTTERIVLHGH